MVSPVPEREGPGAPNFCDRLREAGGVWWFPPYASRRMGHPQGTRIPKAIDTIQAFRISEAYPNSIQQENEMYHPPRLQLRGQFYILDEYVWRRTPGCQWHHGFWGPGWTGVVLEAPGLVERPPVMTGWQMRWETRDE